MKLIRALVATAAAIGAAAALQVAIAPSASAQEQSAAMCVNCWWIVSR